MPTGLKGKTAVITGASSGIGAATARSFADLGCNVALLARRKDRLEQLAEDLGGKGVQAVAVEADVTDRDSMESAAETVDSELDSVDILVNNAGQMLLSPFSPERSEETRRMIEINLLGAMTTLEVFQEKLVEGGGDLVNISSVAGRTARPGSSVYNATKWGLNGWSEALRQELLGKLRVIVIEPGAIDTELTDHISHEKAKQGADKLYEDVAIAAEDVAEVIAFAVSRPERTSLNEIIIRPSRQEL